MNLVSPLGITWSISEKIIVKFVVSNTCFVKSLERNRLMYEKVFKCTVCKLMLTSELSINFWNIMTSCHFWDSRKKHINVWGAADSRMILYGARRALVVKMVHEEGESSVRTQQNLWIILNLGRKNAIENSTSKTVDEMVQFFLQSLYWLAKKLTTALGFSASTVKWILLSYLKFHPHMMMVVEII